MATEELGTVKVDVEGDSAEDAAEEVSSLGEAGGGGGGSGGGGSVGEAMGSITGMLGGMSTGMTAIVGLLGVAVGALLMLEPIQQMISGLLEVASAFLAPLAMMLMTMFQPVLRALINLLPAWFAFIENFQSLLSEPLMLLFAPLMGMMMVLAALKTLFPKKFDELKTKVRSALEWLWGQLQSGIEFITSLPAKIATKLGEVIPTPGDVTSGAADAAGGVGNFLGNAAQSVQQTLDINVSGYNDEQILQTIGKHFGMRGR